MIVGTLTTGAVADVDERGTIDRDGVALRWRVWSRDRWVDPAVEAGVRQTRPSAAPIARTSLRVPGGDAVQRVYAVSDASAVVVVEIENASPEAIAVAFAVDGAKPRSVLALAREPGDVTPDGALVFPIPHRGVARVAFAHPDVDVRALPDADTVARAWARVLDRGMRTELPEQWQREVDAARADALLAPPSGRAFAALEEWGFDEEAEAMWSRLAGRERRAARRRVVDGGVLGAMRAALLTERGTEIDLLPGFVSAWLGAPIAVHDAPLRAGRVSYAVRWHGARPALLWDAPPGVVLRAPALDPLWSSEEASGETLLHEPPPAFAASFS